MRLTDEEVEREIERLRNDYNVKLAKKEEAIRYMKLAKKEEAIRYMRRQYLYTLRVYENKGKELAAAGITMEMLERKEVEG